MGRCQKVPKFYFQSQFSMSKIIQIFLIFFSLKNINLGASTFFVFPSPFCTPAWKLHNPYYHNARRKHAKVGNAFWQEGNTQMQFYGSCKIYKLENNEGVQNKEK